MTIDIKKLAKEAGGTIGFIGGELAHESNRTYIFTKDELKQFAEAYTAKVLEKQSAEIAQLKTLIKDDAFAISFQSMAQYRKSLLEAIK